MIFVCNPNNPTGGLVSRDEVREFMAHVPHSVVVVFDESYFDFVDDPGYSNALEYLGAGQDNVLVLRSFSKAYGMANLRIGYAIGTPAMIGYLAHAQLVFNTGDATLYAAMAALDDVEHVQRARRLIQTERKYLYQAYADLELPFVPTQANFILLPRLPREVQAINADLLQRGIIVGRWAALGSRTPSG